MQQMLDALMAQRGGQGEGGSNGVGGGGGGAGQDGYSVAGNNSAIPAYGPDRLQFSNPQLTRSGASGNSRPGRGGAAQQQPASNISPKEFRKPAEASIISENVPDKYREAVKRYFTSDRQSND